MVSEPSSIIPGPHPYSRSEKPTSSKRQATVITAMLMCSKGNAWTPFVSLCDTVTEAVPDSKQSARTS